MKFVQGDAIAGLIIVFANSIGGLIIGAKKGLPLTESIEVYGLLAIGDGLVNIIPSLLMSLAAGIVITNTNHTKSKGPSSDIFLQLVAEPRVLLLVGVSLFVLSVLPGLPFIPFFIVAAFLLILGFALFWILPSTSLANLSSQENVSSKIDSPSKSKLLSWGNDLTLGFEDTKKNMSPLEEVGVITLVVDANYLEPLLKDLTKREPFISFEDNFAKLSSEIYLSRGVSLPRLKIISSNKLAEFNYQILIRDKLIRSGKVNPNLKFVISNFRIINVLGLEVNFSEQHPYDSRKGYWVNLQNKSE